MAYEPDIQVDMVDLMVDGYEENNGFGGYRKREMKMDKPLFPLASRLPAKAKDDTLVELPENASPLDFLTAVYRDPVQPMPRRMKAAEAALPFVHPKLSVVATLDSFAGQLEAMMQRQGMHTVIDSSNRGASGFGFTGGKAQPQPAMDLPDEDESGEPS